jgi:hypothetical protein
MNKTVTIHGREYERIHQEIMCDGCDLRAPTGCICSLSDFDTDCDDHIFKLIKGSTK